MHSHWTSGQLTCRAAEAESTRGDGGRPGGAKPLDGKHETTVGGGDRRVNLETRA